MLADLRVWFHRFHQHEYPGLAPHIREYIEEDDYPKNHRYVICNDKLLPTRKLRKRVKRISSLYPEKMDSFLDLSCCRGFFVFNALEHIHCRRTLGIDVNSVNIEACQSLSSYLKLEKPRFELLTLDKLANNISAFGGAYQTVLIANMYQYLFFGSDQWPGYLSHEKIFQYLSQICSKRLIFSNRAEVEDCQNKQKVKESGEFAKNYNTKSIIKAAEKYFDFIPHGKIGKYPLWVFERKPA